VPWVAFVIVRVSWIDESISGMRMFEFCVAVMLRADVRLIEISIAIKNDNFMW